eukprot:4209038-Pleurochrysis_carterae.AAC.1
MCAEECAAEHEAEFEAEFEAECLFGYVTPVCASGCVGESVRVCAPASVVSESVVERWREERWFVVRARAASACVAIARVAVAVETGLWLRWLEAEEGV